MDLNAKRFPVWNGELYLEYHRGTLTSVAANKANNRRAERRLRELEYLSAMATVLRPGRPTPRKRWTQFWELVLINQFHDILPGTSIAEVYADSDSQYATIFSTLDSANGPWHSAARAIASPQPGEIKLFNFTGHERHRVLVTIPGASAEVAIAADGETSPLQKLIGADGSPQFRRRGRDHARRWAGRRPAGGRHRSSTSDGGLSVSRHLENAVLRVELDIFGELTSVYDKGARHANC